MTRIYHNPRCSKSRATLTLLRENGVEADIFLYLETPPDAEMLRELTAMLGCSIQDIVRKGEKVYRELGIGSSKLDEGALIKAVVKNPILLERPIVVHNGRAAVGRPPENVLALFDP